jgi:hypothetical protein
MENNTDNLRILKFPHEDPTPHINLDAIEIIEGLLERFKSGHSVALAVVEVMAEEDAGVATIYSKSNKYHQLCSGCARLATRIALD